LAEVNEAGTVAAKLDPRDRDRAAQYRALVQSAYAVIFFGPGGTIECIEVLYAVVHRTKGQLATFPTPYEAGREMVRILLEKPDWVDVLRLERVDAPRPEGPDVP
jgi:tagatose-1,6-bisphosphate aldolase non-catalytic subunit AgaZ/GatZ